MQPSLQAFNQKGHQKPLVDFLLQLPVRDHRKVSRCMFMSYTVECKGKRTLVSLMLKQRQVLGRQTAPLQEFNAFRDAQVRLERSPVSQRLPSPVQCLVSRALQSRQAGFHGISHV